MLSYSTLQTIIQLFRMIADILILWVLLYYTIKIVRNNSRTAQIFKGIILILIIRAVANFFGFKAVDWLAGVLVTYGFLAIIIIFQPEIRTILERLGKNTIFSRLSTLSGNERERLVEELVTATMNLSSNKVGALITLEQGHSLSDFVKTGTQMNSIVTADLLMTLFLPNTPLHDGAVIIQGDRIACASAYFPPTNMIVPTRFGARHRAAIGISEITDSFTIVVSEKSGRVSIAEEGKLIPVTQTELKVYLQKVILHDEEEVHLAESSKTIIPQAPVEEVGPEIIVDSTLPESKVPVKSKTNKPFTWASLLTPKPKPLKAEGVTEEGDRVKTVQEMPVIETPKVKVTEKSREEVVTQEKPMVVVPPVEVKEIKIEEVIIEVKPVIESPVVEAVIVEDKPEVEVPTVEEVSVEDKPKVKGGRKKKVVEEVMIEPLILDEPIPVQPKKVGIFGRLLRRKENVVLAENPVVVEEVKQEEVEVLVEKPKRARKKKTEPVTQNPETIEKIKKSPNVKLEFSVSDVSLLDDDFDSNSSKEGE